MRDVVRTRSVPQIIVSNADYERLTDLATASLERLPEVATNFCRKWTAPRSCRTAACPTTSCAWARP